MTTLSTDPTGLNPLLVILMRIQHDRFYGSLEIKFEAGNVVILKKTETLKP